MDAMCGTNTPQKETSWAEDTNGGVQPETVLRLADTLVMTSFPENKLVA